MQQKKNKNERGIMEDVKKKKKKKKAHSIKLNRIGFHLHVLKITFLFLCMYVLRLQGNI